MNEPVFAGVARELVLAHAVAAIVLVGSATHHAWVALGLLRRSFRIRLARTYATINAIAYVATVALGALAYPTFRDHVRSHFLDEQSPWASRLFELKEDVATLGLPLVIAAWALSRSLDAREDHRMLPGYVAMVLFVTAAVWFNVTAGLLVTMVKGV